VMLPLASVVVVPMGRPAAVRLLSPFVAVGTGRGVLFVGEGDGNPFITGTAGVENGGTLLSEKGPSYWVS